MNLLYVVIDQRLQNYVVALAKMSGKSISFLLFLYVPGDDNFIENKEKRFPMVPASLMFDVLCLSAS